MIPLRDDIASETAPVVTISLIAINVLVYVLQTMSGGGESWAWQFGMIPVHMTQGAQVVQGSAPWGTTLFTSMFLHGGFFHLAGNMLYLWIFGDNVEDRLGHVRFLVFYLVSGVFATLFFVWTSPSLQVPLVGASGAIAGVLGGYMICYPRARVATLIFFGFFIRIIYIPALLVLGFWFVIQLLYGLPSIGSSAQTGGVAFLAHVGGFVAGLILVKPMSMLRPRRVIS